ncbi:MAG: hypothetical protein JJU36_14375 [Phycisphaeraceae bacterium]|nr:hypothetical protein [Phycisphaeraceae bacterium]
MSAHSRIAITGLGLVSPLGRSAWATFHALLQGRRLTDRFNSRDRLAPLDLAELDLTQQVQWLGQAANTSPQSIDPALDIAEIAALQALDEAAAFEAEKGDRAGLITPSGMIAADNVPGAGLLMPNPPPQPRPLPERRNKDITLFLGTSKGAMVAWQKALDLFSPVNATSSRSGPPTGGLRNTVIGSQPLAEVIARGPAHWLEGTLAHRLGVTPGATSIAACASGLVALDQARRWLLHPPASPDPESRPSRRCLVVATEAALLPCLIHSYRRLGVLAAHRGRLTEGRPLHPERAGFMLAQLAAAVVLQRLEPDDPNPPLELLDTAIANDSHDLIRPAPGMPALDHLAARLLGGRDVDALHPHATGTQEHDPVELAILERYLQRSAQVYAVKGALGHGLGAAGLVSLVVAGLCARTGRTPPMPWLDRTMDLPGRADMLTVEQAGGDTARRTHAVFAAGFGGHNAGAVIQRS